MGIATWVWDGCGGSGSGGVGFWVCLDDEAAWGVIADMDVRFNLD